MSFKNSGAWPPGVTGAQAENENDTSKNMLARTMFRFIATSILGYDTASFFLNIAFMGNFLKLRYRSNPFFLCAQAAPHTTAESGPSPVAAVLVGKGGNI